MRFISTRGKSQVDCAARAIVKGLADDGGLFVPDVFPNVLNELENMLNMSYAERATNIIHKFLSEYDYNDLLLNCQKAYAQFEDNDAAPVVKLDDNLYVLELFHGPTLAFKDIALTLLPYLLRKGADITGKKEKIMILVATSGDTGKAALEGFKDKDGISILVFYPSEGVSDMQKMQMQTQEGGNVKVMAIKGNFDDCQTAVKNIFSSAEINAKLLGKNTVLSSANSMNFGRLVPQVCYYFSAYCDMVNSGDIKMGDKVDFVVPTGNFGNILAGYYAKRMGLPVGKLVCASNSNNVLTDFFTDGTYDANREFFKTMSPSMDILISSNLERLIFELSNRDFELTAKRMEELKKEGKYCISKEEKQTLNQEFFGGFSNEEDCLSVIKETFDEYGYVVDPHTAVALKVNKDYLLSKNDSNPAVILSTASPYKFTQNVLKAITGKNVSDAFKCAEALQSETAMPIPEQILSLKTKERRFIEEAEKDQASVVTLSFADM